MVLVTFLLFTVSGAATTRSNDPPPALEFKMNPRSEPSKTWSYVNLHDLVRKRRTQSEGLRTQELKNGNKSIFM